MKKYFDRLQKGQEVKILGKNETPIKKATIRFKIPYSEEMHGEPLYWWHIEAIEKRKVTRNGISMIEENIFTEGRAFFITQLKYNTSLLTTKNGTRAAYGL